MLIAGPIEEEKVQCKDFLHWLETEGYLFGGPCQRLYDFIHGLVYFPDWEYTLSDEANFKIIAAFIRTHAEMAQDRGLFHDLQASWEKWRVYKMDFMYTQSHWIG